MNRNYSFKFAHDSQGSSGSSCAEDYRGPEAFSEPESRAMRDFSRDHPNLLIALNFHAWGPLLITPFNWDKNASNKSLSEEARLFYEEVSTRSDLPYTYLAGNGAKTIGYTANGEASDWMLHELGIFAMSPELGWQGRGTEDFFISNPEDLKDLLHHNSFWIENTMKLLFEKIECEEKYSQIVSEEKGDDLKTYTVVETEMVCHNRGLLNSPKSLFSLEKKGIKIAKASQNDSLIAIDCVASMCSLEV